MVLDENLLLYKIEEKLFEMLYNLRCKYASIRYVVMQQSNVSAILISIASLTLSLVVAYFAYFRVASIKMLVGRNIIFYPSKVRTANGDILGATFNIPVTFYNWSPQGGTVYRIRLLIGRQGQDEYYDMTCTTFVRMSASGDFEYDDIAQPIPVDGRSSISKVVRFDWNPEFTGNKFDVQVGKYDLMIFVWTKNENRPHLKYSTSFIVKEQDYEEYKKRISLNDFSSVWFSLEDDERPNTIVTKTRVNDFYLNKK